MSKASSKIVLLKTLFDVGFVENGTNYIGVEERKKKREKKCCFVLRRRNDRKENDYGSE